MENFPKFIGDFRKRESAFVAVNSQTDRGYDKQNKIVQPWIKLHQFCTYLVYIDPILLRDDQPLNTGKIGRFNFNKRFRNLLSGNHPLMVLFLDC